VKLEKIGFYTLEDYRAQNASPTSPMWRCELIITDVCNFKCPYCRGVQAECKGTLPLEQVKNVIDLWSKDGLRNIRFSGGEPTLHKDIYEIVSYAKAKNIERIAISTNGSASREKYQKLIDLGVSDFSISLDACCASFANKMAGTDSKFDLLIDNIKMISEQAYVTVGIVITEENVEQTKEIVEFAHGLGVADIRVISAAQYNRLLDNVIGISEEILDFHPILKYRIENIKKGRNVRGLSDSDSDSCYLLYDDSVVAGKYHFPCVIYFREGGKPIGEVGENMRQERIEWLKNHNVKKDLICSKNCLDVCQDYNNKYAACHRESNILNVCR
jgi:MoaA/NifB/PqqE/SkfB family radical SAM enzyme